MSCPTGFEPGPATTCHSVCPPALQYTQEYGGEACILRTNRTKRVPLIALPVTATDSQFTAERTRVQGLLTAIETELATQRELAEAQTKPQEWVDAHGKLQQRYAAYTGASTSIDDTLKRLRSERRPKMAPAQDLSADRRWLLTGDYQAPDVRFFQIALIVIILSIVSYFALPLPLAHLATTVLLCVGAALGFFLKT